MSVSSDPITIIVDPSICNGPPFIAVSNVVTQLDGEVTISLAELISDADNNLDLTTLKIISPPISGATAIIDPTYKLLLNYSGIAFSGTDKITIEVCDLLGSCAQAQFSIEVIGEIEVYNAISPNGDNLNEFFRIGYIELLEDTRNNRVTIFNRWGDLVFNVENYDNSARVFKGLTNNGNELPSGTYFYKIEFTKGRESKSGYLTLKK